MKRKPKRKKPGPLALAPINADLEPFQLRLPYLELSPLELRESDELPEKTLKPFCIELQEINRDDISEPDAGSLELKDLDARLEKSIGEVLEEPRKRSERQIPARRADTLNK